MIYAPGFHKLTREQYDAATGIRNTEIGWACKSMAHWAYWSQNPPDETAAKRDGQLIHRAILEPEVFEKTTIVLPVDAPKRPSKTQLNAKKPSPETLDAIKWWHDFGVQNAGKTIISSEESQRIADIAYAVLNDPVAGPIIQGCKRRELAVFSRHLGTGLLLKSSLDLLTDDNSEIWDLKTADNTEPEKYRQHVTSYGYHRQAAYYIDHFARLDLKPPTFGHIIVEKEPPHVVSVRLFDDDSTEIGRKEYRSALHRIASCQKSNIFPGYHVGIDETGLTPWRLKEASL